MRNEQRTKKRAEKSGNFILLFITHQFSIKNVQSLIAVNADQFLMYWIDH
jgi:hypothetical protein